MFDQDLGNLASVLSRGKPIQLELKTCTTQKCPFLVPVSDRKMCFSSKLYLRRGKLMRPQNLSQYTLVYSSFRASKSKCINRQKPDTVRRKIRMAIETHSGPCLSEFQFRAQGGRRFCLLGIYEKQFIFCFDMTKFVQ